MSSRNEKRLPVTAYPVLLGAAAFLIVAAGVARADVSISSKPTQNMNCSDGVCTPTAKKAVLNVGDLASMLAGGDVTVNTGGSLAKDIDISAALSWTGTTRLTLDAYRSIAVRNPVTVAGQGALTIATNDGGAEGDLLFEDKGNVTFWDLNSSLIINGNSYTLIGDIATLAADIAANPSGFYALAKDYDAENDTFGKVPIPTEFIGTFEGLGQNITHLKIEHDLKGWEGFFAVSDGTIRDINLKKVKISSRTDENGVGALVGLNRGTIVNVSVDGTVGDHGFAIGGLVGDSLGTILRSHASVAVTGSDSSVVGGLAGVSDGRLERSRAAGAIKVGNFGAAGGLVGFAENISLSYSTGSVVGGDSAHVGGLAGGADSVDQSFATGSVVAGDNYVWAGGLLGSGSGVSNSYSTGSVQVGSHKNDVGGFAGQGDTITTSYSTGPVAGANGSAIGGFVGKSVRRGNQQDYWDVETSGQTAGCGRGGDCSGLTGLTTEQLKSGLPEAFDPHIWGQDPDINNGFPYLRAIPPSDNAAGSR